MAFRATRAGVLLVLVYLSNHGPVAGGPAKLPDNFPRCRQDDPNLDACFNAAVAKAVSIFGNGIPSLQLLPVDPLKIDKATIEQGGNGPVHFKLDITDSVLKGMSTAKPISARINVKEAEMEITYVISTSSLEGNYNLDGKFTLFPMKGNGKLYMGMDNCRTNMKVKANKITKDGDTYWQVNSIKLNLEQPKNFTVHFDNLFNGNKILGESTNRALNENWQGFWDELRPSLQETFGELFTHIANIIFSKVPEKNIF